jgi:glycosyltransferase involved in cell wall biosynthesis
MKVSVAMVTYRHERFLAEAIQSVLRQETQFPFELVIADDASPDGTGAIAARFAARHPACIRNLSTGKNLGLTRNTARTLEACRGEYIAILEGDDFWCHSKKLQRQAEFLDAHPECAWCFTRARVVDANGSEIEVPPVIRVRKDIYTLEDLLDRKFQPRFCTVMFRNRLFDAFPEWFFDQRTADFPIHVLNALRGNIGLIDEVMACYRVHSGGVWSQGVAPAASDHGEGEKRWLAESFGALLDLYAAIDRHLAGLHRQTIRRQMQAFTYKMLDLYRDLAQPDAIRRTVVRARSLQIAKRPGFLLRLAWAWLDSWRIQPGAGTQWQP